MIHQIIYQDQIKSAYREIYLIFDKGSVSDRDEGGVPEVMRGEETQIIGVIDYLADGIACLPGSHSKWARIGGGRRQVILEPGG